MDWRSASFFPFLPIAKQRTIPMAALLFEAQLVDEKGDPCAQLARILFGVDSIEEKEASFRERCQQKYPHLRIQEPITISPAKLG